MDEGGPNRTQPITIFGWDLYVIAFAVILGGCVLAAIFWIFFDRQGRQIGDPFTRPNASWPSVHAQHN